MKSRDEIRDILDRYEVENGLEKRWAAVNALPLHLKYVAWPILGFDDRGRAFESTVEGAQAYRVARRKAAEELDALEARERKRIFKALLSKAATYAEAAWQMGKGMPYQIAWSRRAFRAPGRPELTLARRIEWLDQMTKVITSYDQGPVWLAQHAAYIHPYRTGGHLGLLLAAAIDSGDAAGQEIFDILVATTRGDQEIGAMGRHVIAGLLSASRPAGWEAVEQLLIAAQRQEGLRQVILESIDESHSEAFRRMVDLIHEHGLIRFSSVVRAVDVWLGLGWQAAQASQVRQTMAQLNDLLQNKSLCSQAVAGDDAGLAYLALCALAFEDVFSAIDQAVLLLKSRDIERRFVSAYFLDQIRLPESKAALVPMLADEDFRVAATAFRGLGWLSDADLVEALPKLHIALEENIARFPAKEKTLVPLVWPWMEIKAWRRPLADGLVETIGDRSLKRLLPFLSIMSPNGRHALVRKIDSEERSMGEDERDILIRLLGDRSPFVRRGALDAVARMHIEEAEAERLESYLTRTAEDLRRGILSLLLNQGDAAAVASAKRLLAAKPAPVRRAGLELLHQLKNQNRGGERVPDLAQHYAEEHDRPAADERILLDAILEGRARPATLEDGLGLFDPKELAEPPSPHPRKSGLFRSKSWVTPAALRSLEALDALILEHRQTPVTRTRDDQNQEVILGNLAGGFFYIPPHRRVTLPEEIPMVDVWRKWAARRPAEQCDEDGLELVRALGPLTAGITKRLLSYTKRPRWVSKMWREMYGQLDVSKLQHGRLVRDILWFLVGELTKPGVADLLLDAAETALAFLSKDVAQKEKEQPVHLLLAWLQVARMHRNIRPEDWDQAAHVRIWRLANWLSGAGLAGRQLRPHVDEVMRATQAGAAGEADILALLVGPRQRQLMQPTYWHGGYFEQLGALSGQRPNRGYSDFADDPWLLELVDRCRRRILAIELRRGDMPTAASSPALALRHSGGLEVLIKLLNAYGRGAFLRGWTQDRLSKKAVYSHLISRTYPRESETPEHFAARVAEAGIGQKRLVKTAMYAPQWARHIECALSWPQFAEAVWWFHAHTKDHRWQVEAEIREAWNGQVSERTPLDGQALLDGAVDVAWFRRIYPVLGEERWLELDRTAKYASGGGGHKRAQLFADAMAGRVSEDELQGRIEEKRHQDVVRALGLLPLPAGSGRREAILRRYLIIQEFLRGSRKFGSQRQASEKLAARIGLENLARTAGYPDPLRLEWAMERQALADLADGPVSVVVDQVTVTLAIDDWGDPRIAVRKNGRRLKNVPKAARKEEEVAELLARKRDLKRGASRTRHSLESAMCQGHTFLAGELNNLMKHPVLRPMLEQLIFQGDRLIGYPFDGGRALERYDGSLAELEADSELRIAHAHDLLATGEWHRWQHECFRRERIQPFKQLFRELYVLTETEKETGDRSLRYAGHQVNPRQAMALLGSRGWVPQAEEGIRRTFHDEGINAWLSTDASTFTPAEVEGMTLSSVHFSHRGQWRPLPLETIPPRLFSEVMRDLDLVVSVAHLGGVDPEATASTIEMRAALLRQTCSLLNIDNVRLSDRHALIDGALNRYSIHLGSGIVHQQPGGHVCLVPVHAQHRGRLFLPFVDDDPRSAEVLSKVLLLARDKEIKDPSILEQILPPA